MKAEGASASIFVSYRRLDAAQVQPLVLELRKEFSDVFDYLEEYDSADRDWTKPIFKRLRRAGIIIPVISFGYQNSPHCQLELKKMLKRKKAQIIPVVVPGVTSDLPLAIEWREGDSPADIARQVVARITTAPSLREHS